MGHAGELSDQLYKGVARLNIWLDTQLGPAALYGKSIASLGRSGANAKNSRNSVFDMTHSMDITGDEKAAGLQAKYEQFLAPTSASCALQLSTANFEARRQ